MQVCEVIFEQTVATYYKGRIAGVPTYARPWRQKKKRLWIYDVN